MANPRPRAQRIALAIATGSPRAALGALVACIRAVLQLQPGTATLPRNGLPLLLSALGLGALVIASLSLLRLVARLAEE